MRMQRLLIPLVFLAFLGSGCFGIGPRIAHAPQPTSIAQIEVPPAPPSVPLTVSSTLDAMPVLAYVELGTGSAEVMRGDSTFAAQDGLELVQGDELNVTRGTVLLMYPKAGMSELTVGTKIAIIPDDGVGQAGIFAQIRLYSGTIWTRFENVFGSNERFSVAANNVVATVRGTGFGVSVEGTGVDVQVADHEVQVTEEDKNGVVVAVEAGQGMRVTAAEMEKMDAVSVKKAIRSLSSTERAAHGFTFGLTKIPSERLQRPENSVRLQIAPKIREEIEKRIQTLRQGAMLERVFPRFATPLRMPGVDQLHVPTTAPSVNGPAAVPLP